MKIKNASELAYILGTALKSYANQVERGYTHVWTPFLSGESTVTVQVTLGDDGSLAIAAVEEPNSIPIPAPDVPPPTVTEYEGKRTISVEPEEEPVIEEQPKTTMKRKRRSEN